MSAVAERVGIALGSNVGDRQKFLRQALSMIIEKKVLTQIRASSMYETIAVGERAGGKFINAAITGLCALAPRELLAVCMSVESALGRNRAVEGQGGPRSIDLDVLFYGQRQVVEPGLILPHPRMFTRQFVLKPLSEIAGELILPTQKDSVHSLLASLDQTAIECCVGPLQV